MMGAMVRIGLLFNYTYSYSRDVLRGVRQFAEAQPDWAFLPVVARRRRMCWRGSDAPDAVLVTVVTPDAAEAARQWSGPVVNVTTVIPDLGVPEIAIDNQAVARLAVEHLLDRGLRNLAFVGHARHLFSLQREQAFCRLARQEGNDVAIYHTRADRGFETYAQQWYLDQRVERWLLSLPRPVGIFTAGDLLGAELTGVCHRLGLRVPEDVALVSAGDDDLYCELAHTPLSSVMVNARRVGFEAAVLLEKLIGGARPPKRPVLVAPLGIHVRRSSEVLAIDDEDVVAAARFIRENAHRMNSVRDVLSVVAVNRRSLEVRFKRALGHGLAEEVNRVRLRRAQRLLTETDLKMPEIAYNAGFSSSRHLSAVFRRELDMSPTEFRGQSRLDGPTAQQTSLLLQEAGS